jgi:hypothetical protein
MTIKHLQQFILVCLKYFFNFDHLLCNNAFLSVAIIAYVCRSLINRISDDFQNGLATVKEDALAIKATLLAVKERWASSAFRMSLVNTTRFFQ